VVAGLLGYQILTFLFLNENEDCFGEREQEFVARLPMVGAQRKTMI